MKQLRVLGWTLTLCSLLTASPRAREPRAAGQQSSQPPAQDRPGRQTFKGGVDVVAVDVNVVDPNGRPIADLRPADFTLAVDGRARKILSAQFIPVQNPVEPGAERPRDFSSNRAGTGGRLIMLVIDRANIGNGRGKAAFEAAKRFVGGLTSSDRVALASIPSGPQVDFTDNHALIQSTLEQMDGLAVRKPTAHSVTIKDSIAFEREDQVGIDNALERECGNVGFGELLTCRNQVRDDAMVLAEDMRERTRGSVIGLQAILNRLGTSETPKILVYMSEGLVIEGQRSDLSWFAPKAAAAHVTLYALQLDPFDVDASEQRAPLGRSADRALLDEGLAAISSYARGSVFHIISDADFAFRRLGLELSGYYLLSFAAEPTDRDGKRHAIKVNVLRKDATLRSRREFTIGAPTATTDETVLADLLRTPLLANEIPLTLTTYTFQDADAARLRVLIAADIDRSVNPTGHIALAFVVFDGNGKQIASRLESNVTAPVRRESKTQPYFSPIIAPPGDYTVKLAVVDEAGRRGSVERALHAQMNAAGPFRATDLLIADDVMPTAGGSGLAPAVSGDFRSGTLNAYMELFGEPASLQGARVTFEVAERDDSKALQAGAARLQMPENNERCRVAGGAVPIALLAPGQYVARAIIEVSGRRVGQVSRPFRILTPFTTAAAVPRAPFTSYVPLQFPSRIETFDRALVLKPDIVSFFLNRLSSRAAADMATLDPAVSDIRAGRFGKAYESLKDVADDRVGAVFLKGLVLLSRDELQQAGARFRDALLLDPSLLPAGFYLGATLAAAGDDRSAATIWERTLITEPEAPFVDTLLSDALLRSGDATSAAHVLEEASRLWPDYDPIRMRLGTAYAESGRAADAIVTLDAYLDRHPEDHERLLLAMKVLHDARVAGRAVESIERDNLRFARYALAYRKVNGPRLDLVEQWGQGMRIPNP